MAVLTNKFHIKQNITTYECNCYTTTTEATPTGGSCWEIKNNGVTCYLGLQTAGKTSYDTPMSVKKNNVTYRVQTQVVNTRRVVINQSANQTITVTCGGKSYTSTFTANIGAAFTVSVTPSTGYIAGSPNVKSGNIPSGTTDYTISASAATKAKYQVTITQSSNQTIKVVCNNTTYTSTFQAEYGSKGTVTLTANTGYNAGKLNMSSFTLTGNISISATAATIKQYTVSVTQPANGNITINGKVGTSFAINHGTKVTVQANANSGYTVEALYVS